MKLLWQLILCLAVGLVLRQLHQVRGELREIKTRQKALSEQATEQKELPGIVRRLGVRVGRVEDATGLTPKP